MRYIVSITCKETEEGNVFIADKETLLNLPTAPYLEADLPIKRFSSKTLVKGDRFTGYNFVHTITRIS